MPDSLAQLLLLILTGLTGSALTAVANFVMTRGQREKTDAKIEATKADTMAATSDVEARTDKLRQEALEASVRRSDKLEDKVEAYRAENVVLVGKSENLQGQVNVLLVSQSNMTKIVADRDLLIGQQTAEIAALRAQLTESATSYRKDIDALKEEVRDLQKQIKELTALLVQRTTERDAAVDKLAAQAPAATLAPLQVAPAGATP